ncbi:MAG: hypothetical protein LBM26_04580 [Methanobrevibacter sp.]|nr:hypothetical protein [Methanobrevibacter sp.]
MTSQNSENIANIEYIDIEYIENKIKELMKFFSSYAPCWNHTFILGSLDYILIALKKDKIAISNESSLKNNINSYYDDLEIFKGNCKESLEYENIELIEKKFSKIEDKIEKLAILPRLDNTSIDLKDFDS